MPPELRRKLGLKPDQARWWYQLTDYLEEKEAWTIAEAAYRIAIELDPNHSFARHMFVNICGDHTDDWRAVLPTLVAWCLTHPKADVVFGFTVNGLLRLAQLTKPGEALALVDALPDATPFQTVRDAFVAHDHRDHLQTLAPERQTIVLALLERLAAQPEAPSPNSKPKRAKSKKGA